MLNFKKEYLKKRAEITRRLKQFSKIRNEHIFYELCFCLLTPQSHAERAQTITRELRRKNFLDKNFNPKPILKKNTRFHNNKTSYLLEAKKKFKQGLHLERDWLIKNIKGMGHKEASHFLRNTGFKNLAILDRHILSNLKKHNVIEEIPKSLSKKTYLEIEDKFKKFSKKVKIPIDHLDLLFWYGETGRIFK